MKNTFPDRWSIIFPLASVAMFELLYRLMGDQDINPFSFGWIFTGAGAFILGCMALDYFHRGGAKAAIIVVVAIILGEWLLTREFKSIWSIGIVMWSCDIVGYICIGYLHQKRKTHEPRQN